MNMLLPYVLFAALIGFGCFVAIGAYTRQWAFAATVTILAVAAGAVAVGPSDFADLCAGWARCR